MQLPADSMRMTAHIGEAAINNAQADLKNQYYDLKKFLLSGTSASYDTGTAQPTEGFDASSYCRSGYSHRSGFLAV